MKWQGVELGPAGLFSGTSTHVAYILPLYCDCQLGLNGQVINFQPCISLQSVETRCAVSKLWILQMIVTFKVTASTIIPVF